MTEGYVLFTLGILMASIAVLIGLIFREIIRRIEKVEAEISEMKTIFIRILTGTRREDDAHQASIQTGRAQN